jgi:hypothetical protein
MDAADTARAQLLLMLDDLPSREPLSVDDLRHVRRRAFAAASEIVERAGVSEADGLVLLKEHAAAIDQLLRERWPSIFDSARGSLISKIGLTADD